MEGSVLCRVGGGNPSDRAVGDRSAAVDVDKLCPHLPLTAPAAPVPLLLVSPGFGRLS